MTHLRRRALLFSLMASLAAPVAAAARQYPVRGMVVAVNRPGHTFTIDTLRDLRKERPDADLFFITGADAVAQILEWKDNEELWDLAHFVAVSRPGHALSIRGLPEQGVSSLEVPALAISSTDCRQRVDRGFPVWYLVPDGVVQYISKHHLYRSRT